jgi:hypothetical protein
LTRKWPIYPELLDAAYEIGKRVSRYVKASDIPSQAHLSLSATASYNNARVDGGRVIDFLDWFVRTYVLKPSSNTFTGETWFGSTYREETGLPLFMTMCRAHPLKLMINSKGGPTNFLESNFDTPFTIPGVDPLYKIEEPIFGLDCQTGYQFLQFAIEQGIEQGILKGPRYKVPGSRLELSGVPPQVRVSLIGEPGNKVRVITVAHDWETVILQPLGHELAPILSAHPRLTSGFLRSWKGFDFATNLARRKTPIPDDYLFMFGDLEAASDNMTHEYTRAMLHGLLDGANRTMPFLHLLVDLLTCAHEIREGSPGRTRNLFVSTSGILMGHPGTKEAVSANWLLAHEIAICLHFAKCDIKSFLRNPRPLFEEISESAGDDFIEAGPMDYLSSVLDAHLILGHRINREKIIITRRAAQYCEEPLILEGKKLTQWDKPLFAVPYDEHCHVDAMKIRLFSPYGKVTADQPGESLPDPAVGKGQALTRKLEWLPGPWKPLKDILSRRWFLRMGRYAHWNNALCFVPPYLGGAGLPYVPEIEDLVKEFLHTNKIYGLLCMDVMSGKADGFTRRLLRCLSTGGEVRGLEFDIREQAHEQYVMSALFAGHYKDLDAIAGESGISVDEVRAMSRPKKRALAKSLGFVAEFDMNLMIEKAWVVKEAIQVSQGYRPLTVSPKLDYVVGFESFLSALRSFPKKLSSLEARPYTAMDEEMLFQQIRNGARPATGEERFVSREVISTNFALLEVPLPGNLEADRAHVRGSTIDGI